MFEKFDDDARRVMVAAQHELDNRRHRELTTEHLLMGLLSSPDSRLLTLLSAAGVTVQALRPHTRLPGQSTPTLPGRAAFSREASSTLNRAGADGGVVSAGALLSAMLSDPECDAYRLLDIAGVDVDVLMHRIAGTRVSRARLSRRPTIWR